MNLKKIIIVGIITEVAAFIVGCLLYMNPMNSSIYASVSASGAYCAKSMELFGGTVNWLGFMLLGGLVSSILMTLLYSFAEKGLPLTPSWKKGLAFGFLFWLAAGVPNSYNTWLLHSYPVSIIGLETFNGLIGALVAGLVIGTAYEKIN